MPERLGIGGWQADSSTRLLRKGAGQIRLSPRAMDVLVYLSERQGEVVSAEELLANLWPYTVRSPNAVAKVMSELRHALEELEPGNQLLETVPKRGYRLHGKPADHAETSSGSGMPSPQATPVEACVIQIGQHSAVVVPYGYGAPQSAAVHLAQQIKRELEARVGQITGATMHSAWIDRSLGERAIRAATNADYSLAIYAEQSDSGVWGSLTLLPEREDWPAHRQRFDSRPGTSVDLTDQMVTAALDTLTVLLDTEHRATMRDWGTRNATAYVALREALPLIKHWTAQTMQEAERLLRQAIDADPKFALAYRWLSGVHHSFAILSGRAEKREAIRLAQQHLLRQAHHHRIDPDVVRDLERHLKLISVATPTDAEEYWHAELERDPKSIHALRRYGELLMGARLIDESERYLHRAMELSPEDDRDWLALDEVGLAQARGQFELSVRLIKRNLERIPDHTWHLYAIVNALAKLGRYPEAQRYLDRLEAISPGWAFLARQHLLTLRGDLRPGSNLIGEFFANRRANNANRGITSFMMGDVDAGLRYWREIEPDHLPNLWQYMPSYEQCWPPHVMADPRYQALLDELGFGHRWQTWMRERAIELTPVTGIEVTTHAPA